MGVVSQSFRKSHIKNSVLSLDVRQRLKLPPAEIFASYEPSRFWWLIPRVAVSEGMPLPGSWILDTIVIIVVRNPHVFRMTCCNAEIVSARERGFR